VGVTSALESVSHRTPLHMTNTQQRTELNVISPAATRLCLASTLQVSTDVPTSAVSARHVPALAASTRHAPAFPFSTRHVPLFPVSTRHVPAFPASARHVPAFPASTRHVPAFPAYTSHVPAFSALVWKVAAAADRSMAPPPSCRPWFNTCTPTLHPTTTHPHPPSG
jgi:hypothetical protein